MPSSKATNHSSPHCWPLSAESARCPKRSLGASLVFTLVLLQANICHSSTLVRPPSRSSPLLIPWASLLFPISPQLPGKMSTAKHVIPPATGALAPLKQKGQRGRNCFRSSFHRPLWVLGRPRQQVDHLKILLQPRGGTHTAVSRVPSRKRLPVLRRSAPTPLSPLDHVRRFGKELGPSPAENRLRFIDP